MAIVLVAGLASLSARPSVGQQIDREKLFLKSLRAAVQSLEQYGVYENLEERERVNRIGYELARESGFEDYPFTFTLIDMPIPNAFALPAGQIFVTRGMLDLGLDDDMLAALLGHEIAHVTESHFLRMKRKATLLNTLSTLVAAGAMYGASQAADDDYYVGPYGVQRDNSAVADLAQGAMQVSMMATELLMRGYSRANEDEADEQGQRFCADAGYDPDGARRLMAKMADRIPQSKSYGYLNTHPYLDDRARAAAARKGGFKIEERVDAAGYRQATQKLLLDYIATNELAPPEVRMLEGAALVIWPKGPDADRLRWERLQRLEQREMAKVSLDRDYGWLIQQYLDQIEEVAALSPESPLIPRLRDEVGKMRATLAETYPSAVKTFEGGIYQTAFLETFRSNYPQATQSPLVALELGKAYSRLGQETRAVDRLLEAWNSSPNSEIGGEARTGLRNLAPILTQLGALEALASQTLDEELASVARERLDERASSYEQIENGADYLRNHPDTALASVVRTRLDELADQLYKKMVIYQRVGDTGKAIEQARRILVNAPLSAAAERLAETELDEPA